MTDYFTDTSGSSLGTSLVQAAYDRYIEMSLRSVPLFYNFADKQPAHQAMPGSSVVLQIAPEMTEKTSTLTETADVDSVAIGNTTPVTITLAEYGNATVVTEKLKLFSLADGGVNPIVGDLIAYNMAASLDTVAQTVLRGGSNVIRENGGSMVVGGATASVASTDTLKSRDIRAAVTKLRGGNAIPNAGAAYTCVLHPDVSMDLRAETGAGGWRVPSEYGQSQERIWNGEIGAYEGARFIESPRAYSATDGASSAKVNRVYVFGKQALAKAVSREPGVVIAPKVDRLQRLQSVGWYAVLGFARYRAASLYRIEVSSTL